MNHAGEIAPLARLARPHVAVITTIEKAHIGYLGSIEAIADEKAVDHARPGAGRRRGAAGRHAAVPAAARCARSWARDTVRARSAPTRRPMSRLVASRRTPTAASIVCVGYAPAAMRARCGSNAPGRAHGDERARRRSARRRRRWALRPRDQAARSLRWRLSRRRRRPRRAAARSRCRAAPRCCSTRATTATAPRCAPPWTCCGCNRRSAASRCSATCWNSATQARPSMRRWPTRSPPRRTCVFACGPLMRHLFDALPDRSRGAHAADSAALAPLVADAVAPGRRDPGQGQPRQPHEARGRGARRRRYRTRRRQRPDAVQPRRARSRNSSSCSTCSATSRSARARRA